MLINIFLLTRRPAYQVSETSVGYKTVSELIIRIFGEKDGGTYECVSTNSLGRNQAVLRLYCKSTLFLLSLIHI